MIDYELFKTYVNVLKKHDKIVSLIPLYNGKYRYYRVSFKNHMVATYPCYNDSLRSYDNDLLEERKKWIRSNDK